MTVLVRLLQSFRTRSFHPQIGCLVPLYRRFHQSEVFLEQIKSNDVKNEEASKWLSNLSWQMKERKKQVELLIDELKEDYPEFREIETSPRDLRKLMNNPINYYSVRSHLRYKLGIRLMEARENKRTLKTKNRIDERASEDNNNPHRIGWSTYTRSNSKTTARQHRHRQIRTYLTDAVPVVFDMDYREADLEQISIVRQIEFCCGRNRYSPEPCQMHITGYKRNAAFVHNCKVGLKNQELNLHENGFDKIFPVEKLVYLIPNAPQLKNHIPGDIYVLGGYISHANEAVALKKAYRMGIRFGSIPFQQNGVTPSMVRAKSRYTLALPATYQLVLDVNLKQDWRMAIRDFARKLHVDY